MGLEAYKSASSMSLGWYRGSVSTRLSSEPEAVVGTRPGEVPVRARGWESFVDGSSMALGPETEPGATESANGLVLLGAEWEAPLVISYSASAIAR